LTIWWIDKAVNLF